MNAGVEAGVHCSMYKKKVIRDLSIIFNGSKKLKFEFAVIIAEK